MKKIFLGVAACAAFLPLRAATIVTNNTGLSAGVFKFLDFENTSGTTIVAGVGTITDNRTGGGPDGNTNAFGLAAGYSSGGDVTYAFTGLTTGGQYNIYANWYGNGADNCAVDAVANSVALGTFNQVNSSALLAGGFTAYQDSSAPADPSSEIKNFVLLGVATVDGSGNLTVVLNKSTTRTYGRFDTIAIAPVSAVPEPSVYGLAGAGALGAAALIRRRRKAR